MSPKQDFGWLRVTQMMWRLNFSVLLLMWTHGNTWILYYICPMHTFYFLMVYATMYVILDYDDFYIQSFNGADMSNTTHANPCPLV